MDIPVGGSPVGCSSSAGGPPAVSEGPVAGGSVREAVVAASSKSRRRAALGREVGKLESPAPAVVGADVVGVSGGTVVPGEVVSTLAFLAL